MNADEFVDATIANLKVLGMLPRSGKLCVRRGRLVVEREGALQGARRWLLKDSREATLAYVRMTINDAVAAARNILDHHVQVQYQDLRMWTAARLLLEMRASEAGLVSLKTTYAGDVATVAAVEVLIERLAAHCADLTARVEAGGGAHFLGAAAGAAQADGMAAL
jgi:hypothetical protein